MSALKSSPSRYAFHLLLLIATLIVGMLYGSWGYHYQKFPFDGTIPAIASVELRNTTNRFKPRSRNKQSVQTNSEQALGDLGYAEGVSEAADEIGVITHVAEIANAGVNLYITGNAEQAILMDMDGKVLHQWSYNLAAELEEAEAKVLKRRFRKTHLYPDGGLAVVYGGHAWLARFDKDSNLLWKRKGGFHHDLEVQADGSIFAIGSEQHIVERINPEKSIIEDFIVHLNADGEELARLSVIEAFENSIYAPMLRQMRAYGDLLHTNTIEVLKEFGPDAPTSWKVGQVLISIREMDTIAVIDMDEKKVVWALTGLWDGQHQPTVLPNGNMLIFDNYGTGMSSVFEFNPSTQEIFWAYHGDASNDFYSQSCGHCQRLPNGNTLITSSDAGRAFEITPEGYEAWHFVNPNTAGENDELIATLFEVVRYPKEYAADWLAKK